jgi:hypothetical protein
MTRKYTPHASSAIESQYADCKHLLDLSTARMGEWTKLWAGILTVPRRALVRAGVNGRKACFSRPSQSIWREDEFLTMCIVTSLGHEKQVLYFTPHRRSPPSPLKLQSTRPRVTDFDRCLQPVISRKGHSSTLRWRGIALRPCEDATQDDTVRSTARS